MASLHGEKERKKALQQKKLQQIILRAIFNGHLDPTNEAIHVLSAHFGESLPHDGKQLLDFFPEKDWVSFKNARAFNVPTSKELFCSQPLPQYT